MLRFISIYMFALSLFLGGQDRGLFETLATSSDVDFGDPAAVILRVKHKMGAAKIDVRGRKYGKAVDAIRSASKELESWATYIETRAGKSVSTNEGLDHDRISTASFRVDIQSVPDRCVRKADEDGDYVKLQYVGWIMPEKKIFSSSFHTGSLPVKIVLGSDDKVGGVDLDKGLRGACQKERRDIHIPASMAFGSEGDSRRKIPPNADLKFSVEVVEVGIGKRGRGL
eukprot:g270.t1